MLDSERLAELANKTEDYMKSISKFNYGLYRAASAKSPAAVLLFPLAMTAIIGLGWVVGEFSVAGCYATLGLGTVGYLAQPFTIPVYCKTKGSKIGAISNVYPFYEALRQGVRSLEKVENKIQNARMNLDRDTETKYYWKKAQILDYIENVGQKCYENLEKCRDKSRNQKATNRLFDTSYFVDCVRSDVSKMFDKCAVDINTLEAGEDIQPETKEIPVSSVMGKTATRTGGRTMATARSQINTVSFPSGINVASNNDSELSL